MIHHINKQYKRSDKVLIPLNLKRIKQQNFKPTFYWVKLKLSKRDIELGVINYPKYTFVSDFSEKDFEYYEAPIKNLDFICFENFDHEMFEVVTIDTVLLEKKKTIEGSEMILPKMFTSGNTIIELGAFCSSLGMNDMSEMQNKEPGVYQLVSFV